MITKFLLSLFVFASLILASQAQKKPNYLLQYLDEKKLIDAEFIQVEQDPEMPIYEELFEKVRAEDPEWFTKHLKKGKPGTPVVFDEKIMSKEQYDGYIKAWKNRKIIPLKDKNGQKIRIKIMLTKESNGKFVINVPEVPISILEYSAETNSFSSMVGNLEYLEPIDAPADNYFGKWTGHEWKSELKGAFDVTKQNFAIGRTGDGKYGLLIYRIQQTTEGQILSDKRFFIRFAPVKKPKK